MLHFHTESHNRCDVKLKANLWDKSAYFVPSLLSEGALRVVPHFVRKKSREQAFQRRDARQAGLGVEASGAHAAHTVEIDGSSHATSQTASSASEQTTVALPVPSSSEPVLSPMRSRSPTFSATAPSSPNAPPAEIDLTFADDAASPPHPHSSQIYRNQYSAQLQNTLPPSQRRLPPLHPSLSGHTWELDFNAARQAYLTKLPLKHSRPATKQEEIYANHIAHEELIKGRYGVRAAMACDGCSEREVECRTYHPECYTWQLKGHHPARNYIGWRCARCRIGTTANNNFVSCNVQWE
ncbi:hypothetical protein B5807_02767 [Epicoccum nigrum]|uniref:Uncharacterized protein n=1 Tax=Epicoccum nigrum TaxID=105696 RepID=A0A1Y2MCP6_EPING|nr:hypothetical protein B5807_02767 [Epicoccum nigrum]